MLETEVENETTEETTEDTTEDTKDDKVYTQDQFSGLLRDRQDDRRSLQESRAESERLRQELAESNKPIEELSPLDSETLVNRADLKIFGESIVKGITDQIAANSTATAQSNTRTAQGDDARNLIAAKTERTEGKGLDAKTVYSETMEYLPIHDPEYLDFAKAQKNFATRIDQYGRAYVPSIVERITLKRNAKFAKQLDESGNPTPPPGGRAPMSPEEESLTALLSGEVSESDIEAMMSKDE